MLDAIVVGSGHNALVAACYLAREGWSVEVFERDTVPGGAVSTVERFPGHLVDRGSSAHLMIRQSGIIEELGLADHGLSYIDCDPWAFAPAPPESPDRPGIVFQTDLPATCASIEAACGARDADAYRRFVTEWAPLARSVMRAFARPPGAAGLSRAFGPLGMPAFLGGGHPPAALARRFLSTGDALLDYYFDDEPLKAALAWFGAQSGPPMSEPGTAPMVGFAALMHRMPPGRAVGGSGALTTALAARLRADGGTLTTGDAVTALRRTDCGWAATTEHGRTVRARTAIAGCHILTTVDLLTEGGALPESAAAELRRGIRVGPGIGMAVRLATDSLPAYPSAPDDRPGPGVHAGLQLLVSDRAHLRTGHAAALAGRLPPRPAALAMTFSALDASLCPEGRHQMTLWSQWHPYRIADGTRWEDVAEREADRVVDEIEQYAPGTRETVTDRYVQSPLGLERELGLVGGNIMHIEMSLDQMLAFRPTPGLAGQRMSGISPAPGRDDPLAGLYLTGASTHPGGGVSGYSGRSAARLALRDARAGGLRRLLPAARGRTRRA
ncbi:phytoene desaturase family protein [Tomitella fengzijianii]|uniref:NAD(P)/FAD-dependent oxidoreductase n=1 Tax=Tomitella fengzijianii TaxID=2597660 RepID=A0A516X482_9ACTN|nr:NAD(P)/FAD-dependent oxidoreductase [Tomitella fengzijianii]QDQ97878.1 NAD(P)/FAD-dependent oxidoreductase [Tomitella fengzijianii]